ncbi:MAG: glycerol-3-phosphate 1-O-acyltransferase PlsY [Eubacteriaceae bacterium]|nr:glycerol-3-phosphate 1-O-acyltransferase PlsY [Eubacteriaceae bacterium]
MYEFVRMLLMHTRECSNSEIILIVGMMIAAYFVGNISPATLIARAKGINIKEEGSGNAGTTNATRVLGKKAGATTLVIDVAKGMLVVLAGRLAAGDIGGMAMAIPVLLGHIWPVCFRFKGGKGVATAFGVMLMLDPRIGVTALIIVVLGVLIGRRMSVGSVVGCIALPFITWYFMPEFLADSIVMAALVLFKHRTNIVRLAKGEEDKISFDKLRSK